MWPDPGEWRIFAKFELTQQSYTFEQEEKLLASKRELKNISLSRGSLQGKHLFQKNTSERGSNKSTIVAEKRLLR